MSGFIALFTDVSGRRLGSGRRIKGASAASAVSSLMDPILLVVHFGRIRNHGLDSLVFGQSGSLLVFFADENAAPAEAGSGDRRAPIFFPDFLLAFGQRSPHNDERAIFGDEVFFVGEHRSVLLVFDLEIEFGDPAESFEPDDGFLQVQDRYMKSVAWQSGELFIVLEFESDRHCDV